MSKHTIQKRAAALLLALLLTGCEALPSEPVPQQEQASETETKDTAQAGYLGLAYDTGEPVSPVSTRTRVNRILVEALYEGLFELDDDFQPVPVLCESYEGSGVTWTFRIKEGVAFWSGETLTANDVAACWQVAIADETSPYHARFTDVASIVPEGSQLTVTLTSPNADFPALLDVPVCRAGTAVDTFADGTGPYRPEQADGKWRLIANENWHGGAATAFDTLTLVTAEHAEQLSAGFDTGDISLTRVERISARASSVNGAFNVYQTRTTDFHYLGFNHSHGALGQAAVRQALSQLLQRASLCTTQLQNYAEPAVLPVNPQPASAAAAESPTALELLNAAGFGDSNGDGILDYIPPPTPWYTPYWHEKFEASILVNSDNPYKVAAAQAIAAEMQAIGIDASVNAVSYEEYLTALERGKFDIFYGETMLTPDFDLRALTFTDGALNYGGYSSEAYEAALSAARASGDKTAFYETFSAELPIVPIAFERSQVVARAGGLVNFDPLPYQLFAGVENWEVR